MKGFGKIILWVVILATAAQMAVTLRFFGSETVKVWRTIGKSAVWRGVNFSTSKDFADFVEFLNESIPPDGLVVLPPAGIGRRALWHTPFMQFYLLPRQVVNCTSGDTGCPANLSGSGAYILVVGEDRFPGEEIITDPGRLLMYNKNWGLYLPRSMDSSGGRLFEFSSLAGISLSLFWSFLWIAALTAGGAGMVTALAGSLWLPARLALGFGLGLGGFSLLLYLLLWQGVGLSPGLVVFLTVCWLGAGALAAALSRRVPASAQPVRRVVWAYLAACAGLTGLAVILAVGKGYHASDEVILWGIKGYGIASLGLSQGVSHLGTRTANYPLNIPVLIAAFRSLFGDTLPQSKMIFPLYFLSLLILILDFLRNRLPLHLAGWLTLAYASAPLVFYHSTIAYANLPLTYYLAGGMIVAVNSLTAVSDQQLAESERQTALNRLGKLVLSGCFLALAAWSRPEGLVLAALVWTFCAAVLVASSYRELSRRELAKRLAAFGLPLVIFSALWFGSAGSVYQRDGWSQAVLRTGVVQILSGNLQIEQTAIVLRSFLASFVDVRTWGILGISILLLALFVLVSRRLARPSWIMIGSAALVTLAVLAMYLVLAQDLARGASWWVSTGLSRMLLPGMTLLWLGLVGQIPVIQPDAPA